MASIIPQKPPSYDSYPSSSYEDGGEASSGAGVTSQLYLSGGAGGADKGVVLRRIRHRRRANQVRSVLQSLLRLAPVPAEKDRGDAAWLELHDAFSAP